MGKINFEELKIIGTKETQDLIDAFTDMSHQVYMRQQELEKQALSDSLTGLPNRLMIMDRLDYQLRISTRDNKKFILMMLDLNHFKEVNDTLGHHIGDELLIQVGKRLQEIIRETDTVARLGGDEFAILLPNVDKENVEIVAKKIDQAIQTTFVVHSYNLNISTSIGITEFPTDATEVNVLMQHADVAMYCAKRNKINYCYYDANVDDYSLDRLALSSDIKKAMNNDELELFYQPKYTIASGELNGVEALLRWDHPSMGYISPEIIVDTAEKVGLIDDLTIWIIGKVAADFDVLVNHTDSINFSINLAVQNLRNENFHTLTSDIINKAKIPPGLITLEVTESGMMINPEQSIDILNQLQDVGFNISIDDFGTGFSSLSYIKKLPVSELKIDKSFVIDMLTDESDRVIVRSTIQLAHNLGLQVVAEGVENRESWDMLRAMECDIAQGYFMCKPMPLNALINHISKAPSFNQLTA